LIILKKGDSMRKYYVKEEGLGEVEESCGTCALSFRHIKGYRKTNCCGHQPKVEELRSGKVKVTSACSGMSNIYNKDVIIMKDEIEE
jgi:hypothetical protein